MVDPILIYVLPKYKDSPITKRLKEYYPSVPFRITSSEDNIMFLRDTAYDITSLSKKILYVTENKLSLLRRCPCTKGARHCGYFNLNIIENCPFDCSYCFLQNYLTNPYIKIAANIEDVKSSLVNLSERYKGLYVRVGTGELGDSLALDLPTGYSLILYDIVKSLRNILLELKTKSIEVDLLLTRPAIKNIIISWTLTPKVLAFDELRAAPVDLRISTAYKVREWGYPIAFHFDPIILVEDWERHYYALINQLATIIKDDSNLLWISLGTLRFQNELMERAIFRFPNTRIYANEFVKSFDDKYRYFISVRLKVYKKISKWLREAFPNTVLYLCMESAYVWREVFGETPDLPIRWWTKKLKRLLPAP